MCRINASPRSFPKQMVGADLPRMVWDAWSLLPPWPVFAPGDTVTAPVHGEISPVLLPRTSRAFFLSPRSRRAGPEPCRDLSRRPESAFSSRAGSYAAMAHQTQQEQC